MGDPRRFVIVGAGLAGAKTAEALRTEGFDGEVVLLGAERHRPYERPPLSKGYLQGASARSEIFVHPEDWYADHHVELRPDTRATGLDRHARELLLDGGAPLRYDRLLLATGASPRRLSVPGADLGGLRYLRTLDDSDALRAGLQAGTRVVVIGAGWVGLETAAAARAAAADVTVLEQADLPLLRVLGPEVATVFAALHRDNGVDLRCGVTVSAVEPSAADPSTAGAVRLSDGTVLPADVVVVGVGVIPHVELARAAGLEVGDGILVDEHLATSDPDILAAGDVASATHPLLGRRVRVEHWANALHQPAVAASTMLGRTVSYDRLPYFFTDQFDLGMEYVGHIGPDGYDQVVLRGDPATREFIAFWLLEGRVLAGMNVNVWDVVDDVEALIRSAAVVDVRRLRDPAVALSELGETAAAADQRGR
jgi:3-phenylpropionate/trans-cinnamate dioxygenase ferredoxin reductase subunit